MSFLYRSISRLPILLLSVRPGAILIATSTALLMILVVIFASREDALSSEPIGRKELSIVALVGVMFLLGIATEMLRYLRRGGSAQSAHMQAMYDEFFRLRKNMPYRAVVDAGAAVELRISNLEAEIKKIARPDPVALEALKAQAASAFTTEAFSTLLKNHAASWQRATDDERLEDNFKRTVERISVEIGDLGARASLNLIIGFVISVGGLGFLGFSIYDANWQLSQSSDLVGTGIRFAMRLSFVVIVQVFAYFFLRLYRQSIFEIKYFQNEITNVQNQISAVHVASLSGDKKALASIAMVLAKTERNFILKKGDSTVSLLQGEQDARYEQAVLNQTERLLDKLGSISRTQAQNSK